VAQTSVCGFPLNLAGRATRTHYVRKRISRTGFLPKIHRLKSVLPQPPDAVGFKYRFVADDRHVFRLRLSNQHAVECVFMRTGQ
jgi:hypothetical protein